MQVPNFGVANDEPEVILNLFVRSYHPLSMEVGVMKFYEVKSGLGSLTSPDQMVAEETPNLYPAELHS